MATPHRHPLVSYQPLKFLFQFSVAVSVLFRLPYYATVSLIPSFRPDRRWSAKQAFMTRVIHPFLDSVARVAITETLTLDPGKEGRRFQTVPVSTLDVYKGPLASEATKPAKIGGTWFPDAPGADVANKTVVLFFHGGAFVQGDGRTATYGSAANYLLKKGSADAVFSLQYRLSGHGGVNPFPAALQDALSSYLFLLNNLQIPPHQIIFAGDSAGATLATSLLLYLHEYGSAIDTPTPKCAVLLSPWVDPFYCATSENPHRGTDFIPSAFGAWGAQVYAGSLSSPKTDPYITSLGNPFPTPVPMFVNVGTAELCLELITQWVEEMRGVKGNVVELYYEEGAVHDTFMVADLLGFEQSAWDVAAKIAEFVHKY